MRLLVLVADGQYFYFQNFMCENVMLLYNGVGLAGRRRSCRCGQSVAIGRQGKNEATCF